MGAELTETRLGEAPLLSETEAETEAEIDADAAGL